MVKRMPVPGGAGLFGDATPDPPKHTVAPYRVNIDGGSRGNPGPAAYGVVVRDARGEVVARLKKYIGQNTNNVAEYFGLIAALDYAQTHGVRALRVESDSELLVKQIRGHYKVNSGDLRPLFERAKKMVASLESFRIDHVYREQNQEADALVNQALDETGRGGASAVPAAKQSPLRLMARCRGGRLELANPLPWADGTEVEVMVRVRK
jgi:ribonuclease HI